MSRTHAPPMTETGVPVSEPDEGQDLRDLSPHAGLELSPALRSHVLDPAVWQEHLETYAEPEQARPLASHEHERGRTTLAVSRRILVVDDERLSAVSWGKLLRTAGHEIRTAHDGWRCCPSPCGTPGAPPSRASDGVTTPLKYCAVTPSGPEADSGWGLAYVLVPMIVGPR
jgi:hypothetical protein